MTIAARVRAGVRMSAAALLLGWALVACSGGTSSTSSATTTPASMNALATPEGFAAISVRVTRSDGTIDEHCLWSADTTAERERGLMGVTDPNLGGHPGMLFRFTAPTTTGFWMKDTLLPLSVAWFDAAGRFIDQSDMVPCPSGAASCPVSRPSGAYTEAIEVPQGRLADLGIERGSTIAVGGPCA